MGINLGDIIVDGDGDLMGDGVNIAARLEALAEPGGIRLSEDAYRQARGKVGTAFIDGCVSFAGFGAAYSRTSRRSRRSAHRAMTGSSRKAYGPVVSDANAPRRRLLRGALAVFASALTRSAISQAQTQQKMSKQEAEYQDSPKDIRMCATCTLFEPPKSCKVVEGDVSPNGWCKAFVLAD